MAGGLGMLLQALGAAKHGITDPRLDLLTGGGVSSRGSAAPPSNPPQPTGMAGMTDHRIPKGWFLQTHGLRKDQLYRVKRGESGQNVRIYQDIDGSRDTALAPKGTLGGLQPAPAALDQAMDPSLRDPDLLRLLLSGRRF